MEEGNHHLYLQIFSSLHVGLVSLGTQLYTKALRSNSLSTLTCQMLKSASRPVSIQPPTKKIQFSSIGGLFICSLDFVFQKKTKQKSCCIFTFILIKEK